MVILLKTRVIGKLKRPVRIPAFLQGGILRWTRYEVLPNHWGAQILHPFNITAFILASPRDTKTISAY